MNMDAKGNGIGSWDSKMSVRTISTAPRHYRRSPSSILSCDSDIRFTRKKLSSQYRCGCWVIACFLLLLLLASAAVYVGYTFFMFQPPEELVFRGTFKVITGDIFYPEMADPSTSKFKSKSRDYKERLNLLFRRSPIRNGFIGTEVLALDGEEGKDLIVHFNIHVDPTYVDVNSDDVVRILLQEITLARPHYFRNLIIDADSLEVKPNDMIVTLGSTQPTTPLQPSTTPRAPRRCTSLGLSYCSGLGYNITTYPNAFGHHDLEDVEEDVIAFRELVDAECYRHARQFLCLVLQPKCRNGDGGDEDEMVLPCRSFCRDFLAGCGERLTGKFKEAVECVRFPEYGAGEEECITKPACVEEMQSRALSPRICDGIIDCQDLSDEKSCSYCPKNYLHCGVGQVCVRSNQRCDGRKDCPDGSDERSCLSLAHSTENMTRIHVPTPHMPRYNSEGYVIFNERGDIGKLCTENLNRTDLVNRTAEILHTVASSLCKSLSYEKVLSVQVEKDSERNVSYVSMKNPTAPEITFIRTQCPSKQVLKVACADLECGLQPTHSPSSSLRKSAVPGDWPWHVALFKDDSHTCDGTLISPNWLITSTSCFQGQPKAEWTARLGAVRLSSSSPWEQERRVIGMVKSPVEGSTVALVRLDAAVVTNDFVRPVCLDGGGSKEVNERECNALGWGRNREQLQRVQVRFGEMEKCENISMPSVNGVCAEAAYGEDDCSEEEFAGSPVICREDSKWSLVGVSNWRIACTKAGLERPRMYDRIFTNIDWIRETIKTVS